MLIAPTFGGAYETDQFNNRLQVIEDSTPIMNKQVTLAIADTITALHGPRDEMKVVNGIYYKIGGKHWVDKLERYAMDSSDVARLDTPSQGRKFYRRMVKMENERQAAEHSAYTERALFGQLTTGSYSNADLVANFEGYLFYRSLFEDDVIEGKPAILAWKNDHWIMQRAYDWSDHVNDYWDEALNINHYDQILYPHMKTRLLTFCDDYLAAPQMFIVHDESALKYRYRDLQLRDTSELRLDHLCVNDQDNSIATAGSATDTP
jgi:hypothetical protein